MTGFHMQTEDRTMKNVNDQPSGNLPFLKPDDIQYFDKLLVSDNNRYKILTFQQLQVIISPLTFKYFTFYCEVDVDESTLSPEEQKERKIMKLLLKIKNGTPPMRKVSTNLLNHHVHYNLRDSPFYPQSL